MAGISSLESLETESQVISVPATRITIAHSYHNDRFIGFIVNVKSNVDIRHFQSGQKFCFDFAVGDSEWTVNIDLEVDQATNDRFAHIYFILECGRLTGVIHQILDYSSISVSNWWEMNDNQIWSSEDVKQIKLDALPTQLNIVLRFRKECDLYPGIRKHTLICTCKELEEIGQIQFSKPDYIVFKGADWQLHARKQFLIKTSPVFEAMFQHNMKESKENSIKITDLSESTIKSMLTFIYNGTIIVEDESRLFELCRASDKYCLDTLKLVCDHEISLDLTEDNIVDRMIVAVIFKLPLSCAICSTFIRDNFRSIVQRDDWEKIAGHKESVLLITRRMGLLGCPSLNKKH